ncbi:MAG: hypothetical protein LBD21_05630 [Tannerellaceae bacterium]|jgi:hypothetical protein|nr:hypothetical protein [Tannerellaceae bacterium]
MNQEFNEHDSLRLITQMIRQAKIDLQKGSGNQILLWGYSIAAIAIINFALVQIYGSRNAAIYAVWALCIPLLGLSMLLRRRKSIERTAVSRIGSMIASVWNACSISLGVIICIFYTIAAGSGAGEHFALIVPVIMAVTGLALFATGRICRFRPCIYGSAVFWAGALACAILTAGLHRHDLHLLVLAACMAAGFVVPGHLLNRYVGQGT